MRWGGGEWHSLTPGISLGTSSVNADNHKTTLQKSLACFSIVQKNSYSLKKLTQENRRQKGLSAPRPHSICPWLISLCFLLSKRIGKDLEWLTACLNFCRFKQANYSISVFCENDHLFSSSQSHLLGPLKKKKTFFYFLCFCIRHPPRPGSYLFKN